MNKARLLFIISSGSDNLNDLTEKFNFINFNEIDSTNNYVKRNHNNLTDLTVVSADLQTAGKGRLGKSFYSPKGTGAYFSLLLKNNISSEKSKYLTVMAAVAAAEEIASVTSRDVKIKWVNDIYIDGKKVCGILTEGSVNPQSCEFDYAVIGIGINLTSPQNDFPDELRTIADSVFGKACTEEQKTSLINGVLCRFYKIFNGDDKTFIERYRKFSFLDGKKINIIKENQTESATALYIDENCNLKVKKDKTGEVATLFSGDVSIKLHN